MKNALKLVGNDGGARTPEREALAAAIADAADYRAKAEATRAGIERARAMIEEAEVRLAEAKGDATRAKEAHTARAVEAASKGTPLVPDTSHRDARVRADDARDDLEAAEAALVAVEASVGDDEYRERHAIERIGEAADLVLHAAPPIEVMLAEAERIQLDLVERRNVLILLTRKYREARRQLYASNDESLPARIDKFLGWGGSTLPTSANTPDYASSPAASEWLKAKDKLLTDPDAALPG